MVMNTQSMIDYINKHDDIHWVTALIAAEKPLLAMALCDVRHGRDCAEVEALYKQMRLVEKQI